MLLSVLHLVNLSGLVCDAANSSQCYFTHCMRNEQVEVSFSGSLPEGGRLSLFLDDSCRPVNIWAAGLIELQSVARAAISAFLPGMNRDIQGVEIGIDILLAGSSIVKGSLFAIELTQSVVVSDVVLGGSITSDGINQSASAPTVGGLFAFVSNSLVLHYIGVFGVEISLSQAIQSSLLLGRIDTVLTLQASYIVIGNMQDNASFPHFDLDAIILRDDIFYCKQRNLDYELRMKQYLLDSRDENGRRSRLEATGQMLGAVIGFSSFVAIQFQSIGVDADVGGNGSSTIGLLIGYMNKIPLFTTQALHCQGSLDFSATGGMIGQMRGLKETKFVIKFSCAFNVSEYTTGYMGAIAETNQGSITLSAALDVNIFGRYSGGIFGILDETNLTISEVVGKIRSAGEGSYRGVLIGQWKSSEYEIPRGFVDGIKCTLSRGCTMDEAPGAKVNSNCTVN